MTQAAVKLEHVTAARLAEVAAETLEEVAEQAISGWDTRKAAGAFQYLIRHGYTPSGACKILGNLTATDGDEWIRLIECAETEGLLDVWF